MNQAIGYARVSSDEQGKSGFGLQSQKATIRAVAKIRGYRLGRIYEEVASAISTSAAERPKLQKAIRAARRHRCPLIVASWDRLSRDAGDIELIVRGSGIEVIDAVVGRDADLATTHAEAARLEEESKMLRERTRAGMLRARQQGKVFGNTRNLDEAQKKGTAATQRNAGIRDTEITPIVLGSRGRSLSAVAAELNRAGSRTARDKLWSKDTLRRVRQRIEQAAAQRELNELAHLNRPLWGIY